MSYTAFPKAKHGIEIRFQKCVIPGCNEQQRRKRMCNKHFHRVRKYGDPNFTKCPRPDERVAV